MLYVAGDNSLIRTNVHLSLAIVNSDEVVVDLETEEEASLEENEKTS